MFEAYHGVTSAQHQSNFNHLSAQGFRMISLSVYGHPSDARYAAVWVQREGPAWVAVHGVVPLDTSLSSTTRPPRGLYRYWFRQRARQQTPFSPPSSSKALPVRGWRATV